MTSSSKIKSGFKETVAEKRCVIYVSIRTNATKNFRFLYFCTFYVQKLWRDSCHTVPFSRKNLPKPWHYSHCRHSKQYFHRFSRVEENNDLPKNYFKKFKKYFFLAWKKSISVTTTKFWLMHIRLGQIVLKKIEIEHFTGCGEAVLPKN